MSAPDARFSAPEGMFGCSKRCSKVQPVTSLQTEEGPRFVHYTSHGVPQGGMLSPTFFNFALVSLVDLLPQSTQLSIYTDDICIWASSATHPQVRARLQKAASKVVSYLRLQGLDISTEKCSVVAFTCNTMSPYSMCVNCKVVPYERSHRFLGVIIDRSLRWSPHISIMKKKLTMIVRVLTFL